MVFHSLNVEVYNKISVFFYVLFIKGEKLREKIKQWGKTCNVPAFFNVSE